MKKLMEFPRRTPNPAPKAPVKETIDVTLSRKEDTKELGWQKVTKRRRKNKKSQGKKTKPDTIVIAKKDNTSYADILRRVKTDHKLCEF